MRKMINILLLTSISLCSICFANDHTQVGRYLLEANGPTLSQRKPLDSMFQITFPTTVITIGDAMQYLLINTGYHLVSNKFQSSETKALLQQRLPLSDQTFGPMSVKAGLLALAGETYQLLVDPVHRAISFELKKQYGLLYRASSLKRV